MSKVLRLSRLRSDAPKYATRRWRRFGIATTAAATIGLVMSTAAAGADTSDDSRTQPLAVTVDGLEPAITPETIRTAGTGQASLPLTLITGDRVTVGLDTDGKPVVREITPAPRNGDRPVAFHTVTRDGSVYLVPSDALSLLERGVLDWDLFNLAELAEHVANGTVDEVPVIVERAAGIHARQAPGAPGATVERVLPSIDAAAMSIDGDGAWWRSAQGDSSGAGAARALPGGALAGVEKVWLNPLLEVSLDDSVPQIGAPVAWDAGYDGSGVTVAVLDTGIDADHPDVAGKIVEQVDFTGNARGPIDGHGHGTHVAATIAGSGDASDGQRPGVAPAADLRIGKVCTDGGSCPGDAIIAGMEWAAQSGSPIVSMSLGGEPSDGTDPLSSAVNQLSAAHGTLFVISAGNSGPEPYTVSSPAAADAALAVAAIDKSGEMAGFSSRGPRVGDDALKPEISAPGVDIVAARAEGTAMGTVVDDFYTTASGTSMAAPHVSGSAAIVAQQNPDLTGSELKGLLMGTALDLGHDLYAQGNGRVDVGRAIDPSVFTAGHVTLGRFEYPHKPVTDAVEFINVTDAPITLDLSGSMTAGDGSPAADGLFELGADQVTVPADGTAEVEVTVDGSVLGEDDVFGAYTGIVEATDADGDLRAAARVQAFLEPERFDVTVEIVPPDGAQDVAYEAGLLVPMDDKVHLHDDPVALPAQQSSTMQLFAGTYAAHGLLSWTDESGTTHVGTPTAPEITVTGDTTVTVDLDRAEQMGVEVGEPTETYSATLAIERVSATGAWGVTTSLEAEYGPQDPNWWVVPSEPVSQGTLRTTTDFVEVPSLTTLRAIGSGPPLSLNARYVAPDVSVNGPSYEWTDADGQEQSRGTVVPVLRLESKDRPSRLVDGGAGTADELAAADVDGKLVLIRPADICAGGECEYSALADRVAHAADAGATGVLVAGESEQISLGLPSTEPVACEDGFDSCPQVEPYTAVPTLTVPAGQADALAERLSARGPVLVHIDGPAAVTEVYALSFATDGRVPSDLPYQVDRSDLDRVEHEIHDDRAAQTHSFGWARTPIPEEPTWTPGWTVLGLPQVNTQQAVTTFVGPSQDGVVDLFRVGTVDFEAPYVVRPPVEVPELEEGETFLSAAPTETHVRQLSGSDTLSWNTGPTVPTAVQPVDTESGSVLLGGGGLIPDPCSGCREGDTFWPTMNIGSSTGYSESTKVGLVNDTGAGFLLWGVNGCNPPDCDISLYDAAGDELEPTMIPVRISFSIGSVPSELPATAGSVPSELPVTAGIGLIQGGTN